jgi:hypothetical protein
VDLGGTNPLAQPLSPGQTTLAVHALIFSPAGALAAEVRVDGGSWQPLDGTDKPLWRGTVTAPAAGKHTLEVRAMAPEGAGTDQVGFVVAQ